MNSQKSSCHKQQKEDVPTAQYKQYIFICAFFAKTGNTEGYRPKFWLFWPTMIVVDLMVTNLQIQGMISSS